MRTDLPPAVPLTQVTPDGMVDVTEFLELGPNCVHIRQYCDMSQWIFVLHAHFPTVKQLAEVTKKRQLDKEWDEWAQKVLTRRLDSIPAAEENNSSVQSR